MAAALGVPVSTLVGDLDDAQMLVMQDKIQEIEGAIPGASLSWDSDEIPPEIAEQLPAFARHSRRPAPSPQRSESLRDRHLRASRSPGFTAGLGGPNQGGHVGPNWYIQYGMDIGGARGHARIRGVRRPHHEVPTAQPGGRQRQGVWRADLHAAPNDMMGGFYTHITDVPDWIGVGSTVARGDFLGRVHQVRRDSAASASGAGRDYRWRTGRAVSRRRSLPVLPGLAVVRPGDVVAVQFWQDGSPPQPVFRAAHVATATRFSARARRQSIITRNTMTKGISLHIGLNRVDPAAYDGWDGALFGCIKDADAMKAIADLQGYSSLRLIDSEATSDRVLEEIGRAAQQLQSGDMFLLTYSGHGGQVPDATGDEGDDLDETWVLYDRMMVDDELYSLWSHFSAGVHIFAISDSCHSGTVAKNIYYSDAQPARMRYYSDAQPARAMPKDTRYRFIAPELSQRLYQRDRKTYRTVQWLTTKGDSADIGASLIYISGCQDNQLSADGSINGLFTETLLRIWDNGAFTGSYYDFWKAIAAKMPPDQSPNYYKLGVDDAAFEARQPRTLAGAGAGGDIVGAGDGGDIVGAGAGGDIKASSVSGPQSWPRTGQAPNFKVSLGAHPYYVFEVTSNPALFDMRARGRERDYASNFYGSWRDVSVPSHLTTPHFQLPEPAWQSLRAADRLYFRIGVPKSPTGWDWSYSTEESMAVSAAGAAPLPGSEASRLASG